MAPQLRRQLDIILDKASYFAIYLYILVSKLLCNLVGHHFEMILVKEGTHPVFCEKVKEALSRCSKSSFLEIALPVSKCSFCILF